MRLIVTGGASGIGKAVARLAAEAGACELLLVDQNAAGLEQSAREAQEHGASVEILAGDLADVEMAESVAGVAREMWGGLDALISNAGVLGPSYLLDLGVEEYDRAFAVNTRPTWLLARATHSLLSASRGAIVATASMAGTCATPGLGAYSASKAALIMLVQQMALEWGPDGIRCNCVSPGPTLTGMTANTFGDLSDEIQRANKHLRESFVPLRKIGSADAVARTILFLAGRDSDQITGINLAVDGGLSIALMPAVGGGSGHRPR